jgi:hypothetical protein
MADHEHGKPEQGDESGPRPQAPPSPFPRPAFEKIEKGLNPFSDRRGA